MYIFSPNLEVDLMLGRESQHFEGIPHGILQSSGSATFVAAEPCNCTQNHWGPLRFFSY